MLLYVLKLINQNYFFYLLGHLSFIKNKHQNSKCVLRVGMSVMRKYNTYYCNMMTSLDHNLLNLKICGSIIILSFHKV